MKTFKELSYYNPSSSGPLKDTERLEKSYNFWKSGWKETFSALGVGRKRDISSNDFYYRRPHVLFQDDCPVAIYLADYLHVSDMTLDLEYFRLYNEKFLKFIKKSFETICTISGLYIDPQWRKGSIDLPLGDILFGIAVKNFLQVEACGFISCVRDNRGVNRIFSQYGAQTIAKGSEFNVDVSFMYLDPKSAKLHDNHQINKAVDYLWSTQFINMEVENEKRSVEGAPRAFIRYL